MNANPSPEWTETERLAVIAEHANNALVNFQYLSVRKSCEVFNTIRLVSTMPSAMLETCREQILTLA